MRQLESVTTLPSDLISGGIGSGVNFKVPVQPPMSEKKPVSSSKAHKSKKKTKEDKIEISNFESGLFGEAFFDPFAPMEGAPDQLVPSPD